MSYLVSYTHSKLGSASVIAYENELASILRNLAHLSIQGHEFSNVTIKGL